MHKLLIEDDEGKTVAVPLIREEITIGRMDGNTIRLTEQNVSRKHARLSLRSGVLRIEDLGSYNGTSLNGSVLSGVATLKDGDVILIGDYRLGIQEDRTSQPIPVASQPDQPSSGVPTVEGPMDGQPTIPISTMAAQTAFMEPPARLVALGRLLSGTEFVLDRPSLVIGRTPENDIILNHKSISRHHAKIVREGNRYVILDLESANGVRVRGTEHDRVELQANDVIELGQVRLRFLAGDSVYDEPQPWFKNKRLMGLAAGGGVLGLVLVLLFSIKGNKVSPPSAPSTPPPTPVVQVPPPASIPLPPVQEPAKPAEPQVPIADLIADAKAKAQAEAWEEALAVANKALYQEPTSTDAANLRKTIEAEKLNSEKFAALKEALDEKNFEVVLQGAPKIPDDSVYKERANQLHKNAKTQFIAFHLLAAKEKLAAGDCDQARQEAESVLGIDENNKKASTVIRRCEALANRPEPPVVAVAEKPAPRRPAPAPPAHAPTPKPKPAETPKTAESPATDPDKLIKDAQQAWFRGQYAAAIDSARKALRAKPNLTNAYQIIAVCSCALHDQDSATKAYEKLDERNKLYVKSACQKNGISF
jgi:pSer/pThr/pTyr-binding forkhead associated (FHA) protein/tetratricopeptide (TPR) repeat protein